MIDILFRFSVLNTAITAIGKEIGDTLYGLRQEWHLCLAVWAIYFGWSQLEKSWLQVDILNGIIFVCVTFYLAFVEYIRTNHKWLKFLAIRILVNIAQIAMHITSPVVLWFYVWVPLNRAMTCLLNQCTGEKGGFWSPVVSVVLLMFFSALVLLHRRKSDGDGAVPQGKNTTDGDNNCEPSTSGTGQKRRAPSARIRDQREKRERERENIARPSSAQ